LLLIMMVSFGFFAVTPANASLLHLVVLNGAIAALCIYALRGIYFAMLDEQGVPTAHRLSRKVVNRMKRYRIYLSLKNKSGTFFPSPLGAVRDPCAYVVNRGLIKRRGTERHLYARRCCSFQFLNQVTVVRIVRFDPHEVRILQAGHTDQRRKTGVRISEIHAGRQGIARQPGMTIGRRAIWRKYRGLNLIKR